MIDIMQMVQDVLDGKENPLKAYAILKDRKSNLEKCIKEIEEHAFEEASKYNEKTFEDMGFKFELRDGSRRYNFRSVPKWREYNDQIKYFEKSLKDAANAYQKGKTMIDDNGEVVPVPEVTYTKPSISVKPIS